MAQLANCRGVEIFRSGNWKGRPYTNSDLDRIVENFKKHSTGERPALRPQAVIGHEKDQSLLSNTGLFSVGEIKNLWREGDYLKADIANIPKFMANLINGRAYNGISAEIYQYPPEGINAKGEMLRRVAFMGGDIPHIKSLAELPHCDYEGFSEELHPPPVFLKSNRAPSAEVERGGVFVIFSEVIKMDRDAVIEKLYSMSDEEFQPIADMVMGQETGNEDVPPPEDTDGDGEVGETGDVYEDDKPEEETPEIPEETPDVAKDPMTDDDKDEKVQKYSEFQGFQKKLNGKMKAIEDKLIKADQEAKKTLVTNFCEAMLKEGRITSVHLDNSNPKIRSLIESLMAADSEAVVQTFSEGGKKFSMTELDLRMEEIRNWPVIAKFGEKMKSGKVMKTTDEKRALVQTFAEQNPDVVGVTTKDEALFIETYTKNFDEFKNSIAPIKNFNVAI
jgi:hypothetical protein